MSDTPSFATALLGKKAELRQEHPLGYQAGKTGEVVCIHQDNGGNLRYTLLMEDGGLVCLHDDAFKIVK
jgi:hypothetical protein